MSGKARGRACVHVRAYLCAGLLMFARQIVEASRGGVNLCLQREPQGLVILLGDETFLCSLLGFQLPQLRLLFTQSLLGCRCTALFGLQRALQLCLRTTNKNSIRFELQLWVLLFFPTERNFGKLKLFQTEKYAKERLTLILHIMEVNVQKEKVLVVP